MGAGRKKAEGSPPTKKVTHRLAQAGRLGRLWATRARSCTEEEVMAVLVEAEFAKR